MTDERATRLWHLPGWPREVEDFPAQAGMSSAVAAWHEWTDSVGGVHRTPKLTDAEAAGIAAAVRNAALVVRGSHDHRAVVRSVSRAALRLADERDPHGEQAMRVLTSGNGWRPAVARATLAGMAREWQEGALLDLIRAELGDPGLLDGFVEDRLRPGRRRKAVGPPLQFQLHAGNVPGVPVTGAMLGLIARSGVLAKTGADEPGLLPLFARSLASEDERLARCLAVTWWPGEEPTPVLDRWAKEAGKAVVYGGDSAILALRKRLPATTDLVTYGPRVGVAVLLEDAPREEAGQGIARDVCAYEQRGCVSPRIVFVVGDEPWPVAAAIGEGLASERERLGPPPLAEADAVTLRSVRAECEFEGLESGRARVLGPDDLSWTILARSYGGIESMTLPRTVWLYGVRDLEDLEALLRPLSGRVQSIGYAGKAGEERLASLASELGVSRMTGLGRMAWPPADWMHDGRHRLLPMLSWTDWETES